MDFIYHFCLIVYLTYTTTASLIIKRELLKAGFHRDLETKLHLPRQFVEKCASSSLLIFETLPSGVYADPFEIESQERFRNSKIHFVQPVNIEAAEFASKSLELYVFLNISTISLKVSDDVVETRVVLPIHARYHQASVDPDITHASVMILHPGFYTNCSVEGKADSHALSAPCDVRSSDLCTWYHLSYQSTASHVTLTVPVGQAKHKTLVTVGTILVSVIASSVLVKVIMSRHSTGCDKSS